MPALGLAVEGVAMASSAARAAAESQAAESGEARVLEGRRRLRPRGEDLGPMRSRRRAKARPAPSLTHPGQDPGLSGGRLPTGFGRRGP